MTELADPALVAEEMRAHAEHVAKTSAAIVDIPAQMRQQAEVHRQAGDPEMAADCERLAAEFEATMQPFAP